MIHPLAGAIAAILAAGLVSSAAATDLPRCPPRHHRHVARHAPAQVVYGRAESRRPYVPYVYNHEDNGVYDGADVPPPRARDLAYGQAPSWLDGYGTRPVVYPGYGTYNTYGGSSQVWPAPIPPAGGLAVYTPGAYGPGPRIVEIPGY